MTGFSRRALLWLAGQRHAQRLISRAPLSRSVARRFVAGERVETAVAAVRELNAAGIDGVLNLLGEGVTTRADADEAATQYERVIAGAGGVRTTITVKLSQLGLILDRDGCHRRLRRIAERSATAGVGLEVDMEQSGLVAPTIETVLDSGIEPLPRLALQVCLIRSPGDLERLLRAGARVRLVKGAYAEDASVALQDRRAIGDRYREMTTVLLERGDDPAFGTHDTALIDHATQEARRLGRTSQDYELQLLFGVRRDLQLQLAAGGLRVRAYVPFGPAWYPYLMRRLAEQPANLRFFARALVGR